MHSAILLTCIKLPFVFKIFVLSMFEWLRPLLRQVSLKNGPIEEINNYLPISILPVLSKVLEKHVSDSLTLYLNENNLLHKTQSGFRPHHSCETALNFMTDSWLNANDDGKMIGVVLVDFKKAFDLVDHDILMT